MKAVNIFLGMITILLFLSTNDGMAQKLGEKVYLMETIEVTIGKLESFHAFNSRELVPLMEENGYTFVAVWQTIVGDIEEIILVAEFEDMNAYHKAKVSLFGDIDWKTVSKKLDSLSKSIHTQLLSTAPY